MSHQFTFSDLPQSRKQLTITAIDQAVLDKAEKKVLQELSKNLKIKGFRPGKIPENVVRENVEAQYIEVQTLQEALPEVANGIVQQEKMKIIGEPQINFESVDPLKIVIEFDVHPEVTVGDYKTITVKEEKKTASDKEVEEAIQHVQERMTDYNKVDRAAKKGDRIEVDFDGKTPDGVPLENTSSKHHPVVIGSNMLIPGFEDELIGLKAGDEKEFTITFPKDYHAEHMAGKPVVFAIKVHHVEESQTPDLNEEFVEKITGKKQKVDEWKKSVKDQIQDEHNKLSRQKLEEDFYDKLIEMTKGELPQSMIEQEKQAILRELKQQILQRGLSYERYLESAGKTEDQLLESYDKQASDRIKLRLALQKISEQEKIEVTDVDVEERLNELLKNHPEEQKKDVKKQYQPGTAPYETLSYQIGMQKTLEKILPKG